MSRTIKLEDEVYDRLEAVRGKRETFSQAVERLLSIVEAIRAVPLGPRAEPLTHQVLTRED